MRLTRPEIVVALAFLSSMRVLPPGNRLSSSLRWLGSAGGDDPAPVRSSPQPSLSHPSSWWMRRCPATAIASTSDEKQRVSYPIRRM